MSSFVQNCVRKRAKYREGDAFTTHALEIQGLICQVRFRLGYGLRIHIELKNGADAVVYYVRDAVMMI